MSIASGSRRALLAVGVAVAVFVAACSGSSDPEETEEETSTTAQPGDTRTAELELGPDQVLHEVGATFQSGPFLVTIGDVVFDREAAALYAGIRLQNLSDDWVQVTWDAVVDVDGEESSLIARGRTGWIPSGFTADVTADAAVRDGDPLADGAFIWGRADESQIRVGIADGAVEGRPVPVDVPIDGWVQIGKHTVHVAGGRVFADAVRAPRAPGGDRVLRLYFDEWTSRLSVVTGFFPSDHFQLVRPDGTTVEPLGGSEGWAPQSWTATTGNWVDFPVPAEVEGDYELLLASVSKNAFGLHHPELIERVPMAFTIATLDESTVEPPASSADDGPTTLPQPRLPSSDHAGGGEPVNVDLDVGEVNVPGFGFTPTELRWDPTSATATLTGRARLLPIVDPPDPEGLLTTPSQFSVRAVLASDRRLFDGQIETPGAVVEPDEPREFTFTFQEVTALDEDDVALLIGHPKVQPSVIPLTSSARFVLDPSPPDETPIAAEPIQVGDYTVELVAYRFGLPNELDRPPLGERALEVIYDVTASPGADPGGIGLGFRSVSQLLISQPDSYLQQPAGHSGDIALEPGETKRTSATYYVPVTWRPGRMAFAARSTDESGDVLSTSWTEVIFAADLHDGGAGQPTLDARELEDL